MAETADDKQREALLEAAMDLLGDIAGKLGLFERQRYWHLHQEFIQRKNLPTALMAGLNAGIAGLWCGALAICQSDQQAR